MKLDLFLMYYVCRPCLLTLTQSKNWMACAFSFPRTCLLRYRKLLFQALFSLNCLYLSLGEAVVTILAVDLGRSAMELAPGVFVQPHAVVPCLLLQPDHAPHHSKQDGNFLAQSSLLYTHMIGFQQNTQILFQNLLLCVPKYASASCWLKIVSVWWYQAVL